MTGILPTIVSFLGLLVGTFGVAISVQNTIRKVSAQNDFNKLIKKNKILKSRISHEYTRILSSTTNEIKRNKKTNEIIGKLIEDQVNNGKKYKYQKEILEALNQISEKGKSAYISDIINLSKVDIKEITQK